MLDKQFITQDTMLEMIETFPGIIFQKNIESRYVAVSELLREFCHCPSKDIFVAHLDVDLSWYDLADYFCAQDRFVIQGNTHIDVKSVTIYNEEKKLILTRKIPVVDCSKKIIGVGGFITPISEEILLSFSQYLFNDIYTKNYHMQCEKKKKFHYKELSFTRREAQCLNMILRGATMGEIADKLCRTPRTIEKYYESLREKLGSTKRSIVFQKAIEYGFIDLMFKVIE